MAQSLTRRPAATGSGLTSDRTRRRMIERLQEQGIRDERVLAALYAVPRHLFVDPALASRAYDDTALPLDAYWRSVRAAVTRLPYCHGCFPKCIPSNGSLPCSTRPGSTCALHAW